MKVDGIVKSSFNVIPAKAGIQKRLKTLDSGLRRNDESNEFRTFNEFIKVKVFCLWGSGLHIDIDYEGVSEIATFFRFRPGGATARWSAPHATVFKNSLQVQILRWDGSFNPRTLNVFIG